MECYKQIDRMIVCLIVVWLIEWNSKLLKAKWEGIKGLSQTFIFCFYDLHKFKFFSNTKPWREDDMTSSIYLNDKGCWKYLNFIWKIFPILELYATQWFSWAKIKWLLQNIWNMSWEFQRIKFKVLLNLFSICSYFSFIQIIFLQK